MDSIHVKPIRARKKCISEYVNIFNTFERVFFEGKIPTKLKFGRITYTIRQIA